MKKNIKNNNIVTDLLFFVPPVLALFAYFIGGDTMSGKVFMICNVMGTALLMKCTNSPIIRSLLIAISIYFITYLFIGKEYEGARMYLSSTLYTIVTLLYFSNNKYTIYTNGGIKKMDKLIGVFASVLILGQMMSIDNPMSFIRLNYNSVEEDALNKKGFLISHAFGYYLAAFAMYYAYRKKVFNLTVLTLLCFFFSRRTVVLLCLLGWFYYFKERFGKKKALIISSIAIVIIVSYIGFNTYFGNFAFSLDPYDSESASFTSGRSRFWGSFIYFKLLNSNTPLNEIIFGAGPASSRDFNLQYCGLNVWMHNDFFDLLFCLGIIGLAIYIYAFISSCKQLGWYFGVFVLIAANMNGFMLYQTFPIIYLFVIIKSIECYNNRNGIKK